MNENMSSIRLELLDKERQTAFQKLSFLKKEGILAGGTALSLQVAHRLSLDFDIFLNREIKRGDVLKLKENFKIQNILYNTPDQLTIVTINKINISFINSPFKQLFRSIKTNSLSLSHINDISADKAYTVGRRAVWRDYVDMYFILKNHLTVQEIIKFAGDKFGLEFNPKLFLEQLVYFEDLDIAKIAFVEKTVAVDEIKDFLIKQVKVFRLKNLI